MNEAKKITVTSRGDLKSRACNLFFVSTALHLLNAIEAQYHFKTKNNILVLLCYGKNPSDETQLNQYLEHFPYDALITFKVGNSKFYHKLNLALIKQVNRFTYEKVFLGYFSANLRRFVCNIPCRNLFLLDDGTYLVALHNELYNPNFKESQHLKLIRSYSEKPRTNMISQFVFLTYDFYRRFYFSINGFKNDFLKINLSFFTIFNIPQYQNEIIVNHYFKRLKEIYNQPDCPQISKYPQTVYFLGQPLDKAFGINACQYKQYLEKIHSKYIKMGIKIIYIPHRSESPEVKLNIQKMQSSTFHILPLLKPFEIYLLEEKICVECIASFFSSALFTTKKIFQKIKVDAFKIPFDSKKRSDIEVIYDTMLRENIEIHHISI